MEETPSDLELIAASSLLLLSCESFSSTTASISKVEEDEKLVDFVSKVSKKSEEELRDLETSTDTTQCPSSLTADDSVEARDLEIIGAGSVLRREFKLKVARKARSKVIYKTSSDRKPAPVTWKSPPKKAETGAASEATDATTITTEGSCLSSGGSSEISSKKKSRTSRRPESRERKSRAPVRVRGEEGEMVKRRGMGSFHIRNRAEAIMRMLSVGGCASEVRIRQVLGDSPDTSKALRMLLRMEEVKRTGVGGRSDPFIYKIPAQIDSIASQKPRAPIV